MNATAWSGVLLTTRIVRASAGAADRAFGGATEPHTCARAGLPCGAAGRSRLVRVIARRGRPHTQRQLFQRDISGEGHPASFPC